MAVETIGQSWLSVLEPEFHKDYYIKLSQFLEEERSEHTVYPPADQVFTWTRMCDIEQVKVVILGQDPYKGHGQAHGLSFSVPNGVPVPPSLRNIYQELQSDPEIDPRFQHPGHGSLFGWARQGVLLLNSCLTVRAEDQNSHAGKGWETFTDAVISLLNNNKSGIVFMLWGAYAQKKGACIDRSRHRVLTAPHPSPLAAWRGFSGCKHFSECNTYLHRQGKTPINWSFLCPRCDRSPSSS